MTTQKHAGTQDAVRLDVRSLSTSFATEAGRIQSVADVSFSIRPGQTLALVGESGSGKSVTSLSRITQKGTLRPRVKVLPL